MTEQQTREWLTEHGDRSAPQTEILRTVVGSGVHGIAIEGTDDHDEMGVYVEPLDQVFGIAHIDHHYVARTVPEGHRSRAGDVDLVLYSLRRFVALAATGNPTALLPLFAPESDVLHITDLGRELRAFGPSLLSQQAGWRFLGFAQSQRQRVAGQDRRHIPNRPELVAAHGFDTKYASHALRLVTQGLEVLRHGGLTLPLPEADRQLVLAVKRGEIPRDVVLEMIDSRGGQLERLLRAGASPLPERPDMARTNRWLADAHLAYWARA